MEIFWNCNFRVQYMTYLLEIWKNPDLEGEGWSKCICNRWQFYRKECVKSGSCLSSVYTIIHLVKRSSYICLTMLIDKRMIVWTAFPTDINNVQHVWRCSNFLLHGSSSQHGHLCDSVHGQMYERVDGSSGKEIQNSSVLWD